MCYKFFPRSLFYRSGLASLFCVCFALFAAPSPAMAAANTSYVRIIHASPFVGIADVFVDGQKLLSSFQFAAVTDYVPVPAGVHKVQISLVGKGINAAIISQDLTISPATTYTVAALGANPQTLSLQVFVDNNQVAPNKSKMRLYQLSPDATNVKIGVGDDATLQNMLYPKSSDYISLSSGPCTIDMNVGSVALPKLSLNLTANTVTSVFAVGLVSGNPQIRLVSSHVQGLPGLPDTGSDPNAGQPSYLPWLLACCLLVLCATAYKLRRR